MSGTRFAARAVVLAADAVAMVAEGYRFWRSANGVWLADHVPPAFLCQNGEECETNHPRR